MKVKKIVKESIPYVVVISLLLMDVILFSGLINRLFDGDKAIKDGAIAFVGAVVGGALTLIGVRLTIATQIEKEKQRMKEKHRTYLSASTISFNLANDKKRGRKERYRIYLTESYKWLLGTDKETSYYSVVRNSGTDIVTNCKFVVTVGSDENFHNIDIIEVWVDYFEKDVEILIPLCSTKLGTCTPWVKDIQVIFKTLNNEKVEFRQSEVERKRQHIFYENDEPEIVDMEYQYTSWVEKNR